MKPHYMSIDEFVHEGYLQEVNRLFFHPLGMALEVVVDGDGDYFLGGIWDYRGEPGGILFEPPLVDEDAVRKARTVNEQLMQNYEERLNILDGSFIQLVDPENGL